MDCIVSLHLYQNVCSGCQDFFLFKFNRFSISNQSKVFRKKIHSTKEGGKNFSQNIQMHCKLSSKILKNNYKNVDFFFKKVLDSKFYFMFQQEKAVTTYGLCVFGLTILVLLVSYARWQHFQWWYYTYTTQLALLTSKTHVAYRIEMNTENNRRVAWLEKRVYCL